MAFGVSMLPSPQGPANVRSGGEEVQVVSAVAVSGGACRLQAMRTIQSAHAALARQMEHITMSSNGAGLLTSPNRRLT